MRSETTINFLVPLGKILLDIAFLFKIVNGLIDCSYIPAHCGTLFRKVHRYTFLQMGY